MYKVFCIFQIFLEMIHREKVKNSIFFWVTFTSLLASETCLFHLQPNLTPRNVRPTHFATKIETCDVTTCSVNIRRTDTTCTRRPNPVKFRLHEFLAPLSPFLDVSILPFTTYLTNKYFEFNLVALGFQPCGSHNGSFLILPRCEWKKEK